ncbi:MAG TPA: hypothetical protein VGC79_00675 [Polyangiaceae bacterium]
MSNRRWWVGVLLVLVGSLNAPAFAQGEGAPASTAVKECARAYENSQVQRGAGAIFSARLEFERCARADCPAFIRNDCSRWSKELEAEQPTVLFSARRGSRALTEVRVSSENRVLLERLNDQAIELDPGEYDFRFESAEGGLVVVHARVQAGSKEQRVQAEFAPTARAHSAESRSPGSPKAASTPPAAAEQPGAAKAELAPGPGALPWVLLALGTASIGTGAGLSVSGHSDELALRDTCSPRCSDAQVAPVHTKYLLSNISFGVGLVSLSAAAYLFLRQPDSEHAAKAPLPPPVTVIAGPSSIQAAYGARF